jgi:Tn3 transposase DDE domain
VIGTKQASCANVIEAIKSPGEVFFLGRISHRIDISQSEGVPHEDRKKPGELTKGVHKYTNPGGLFFSFPSPYLPHFLVHPGFSYAPRIKNLKRQHLFLFKTRRDLDRSQWKITPAGYIEAEMIVAHWDDILRLISTLKLKEVTSSELFRRLNSYSKQHTLYRALKAFGKILKSLFILRYIDDVTLRQAIERQLNKIELAHRFTRAESIPNRGQNMCGNIPSTTAVWKTR